MNPPLTPYFDMSVRQLELVAHITVLRMKSERDPVNMAKLRQRLAECYTHQALRDMSDAPEPSSCHIPVSCWSEERLELMRRATVMELFLAKSADERSELTQRLLAIYSEQAIREMRATPV